MRLLIVTQVVDRNDPVLGFFHRWIEEFAKKYTQVSVICLREGAHALPGNVRVYSLGKEKGTRPAFIYASRFLSLAWKLRSEYDGVFVHMNQEYILLAGVLWRALGKKIYLWRNHYAGGLFTRIAVFLSHKVFCTSRASFTARFTKTVLMPVGVDIDAFQGGRERAPRSILFFARIAPSKRLELFIDALKLLAEKNIHYSASVYGSPLEKDTGYYEAMRRRAGALATFHPGVPHSEAPSVFSAHEIFVNTSPSGMYDKTLFEAAASGCIVLAASRDFAELSGGAAFSSAEELARALETSLEGDSSLVRSRLQSLAKEHSVEALGGCLEKEMSI